MNEGGKNRQRKTAALIAALLLAAGPSLAQSKRTRARADTDRLGMACAQILKLTSTEWVAKYTAAKSSKSAGAGQATQGPGEAAPPEVTIRAINTYGKCYDARTERLATLLGRAGKGPLMGARGDFGDFEKALDAFEVVALRDSQPPAAGVKKAYAALYEKRFRYVFYQGYTEAGRKAAAEEAAAATAPATGNAGAPGSASKRAAAATAPKAETEESSSLKPAVPNTHVSAGHGTADDAVAEFTKTKNRFGQLLEALPEDHARVVHEAFGEILGAYEVSQDTRRDLYLYAIFLLELPSAKPFAPPPF